MKKLTKQQLKDLKHGSGLILTRPKPEDARYNIIFGGEEPATPINWYNWLPNKEFQHVPFCVTFSRLNCAETKARHRGIKDIDGNELNLSDRCLGVESGTTQSGNDLGVVSNTFKKIGTVKETDCPFNSYVWNDIFNLPDSVEVARRYFGGNYSWLTPNIQSIKNALAYSPVQIGIGCGETYYDPIVTPPNKISSYHAVLCYNIDDNYIYIYDSIQPQLKKLIINYPIQCAMSFRDLPENWRELQDMKILKRDPQNNNEVYAFSATGKTKRHIANLQSLKLGASGEEPEWAWDVDTTIVSATQEEFNTATEGAEIAFFSTDAPYSEVVNKDTAKISWLSKVLKWLGFKN